MHSLSSQCLWIGVTAGDLTCLSWWLDRHFVSWKASDVLSNSFAPYCRSCVFTLSKKWLWGQMPEQLRYWLDSCHGNQGAWQLMFHPQINYGMLLIEENADFFSPLPFLPPELDSGAFASLSHLFPVLWCDTHTEWITFLNVLVVIL